MTICVIPCNRLLFYGSKLTLILLYATPNDDILSGGVDFGCFHRNIYEIIATRGVIKINFLSLLAVKKKTFIYLIWNIIDNDIISSFESFVIIASSIISLVTH